MSLLFLKIQNSPKITIPLHHCTLLNLIYCPLWEFYGVPNTYICYDIYDVTTTSRMRHLLYDVTNTAIQHSYLIRHLRCRQHCWWRFECLSYSLLYNAAEKYFCQGGKGPERVEYIKRKGLNSRSSVYI